MKKTILMLAALLSALTIDATGPQRQYILNDDGTYTVLDHPGYGCCSEVGRALPSLIHTQAFSGSGEDGLTPYGQKSSGVVPTIGEITIPVIMVGYPDLPFQAETTKEKVTRMFNEKGYADYDYVTTQDKRTIQCHGSVRDYFMAQSRDLFRPNFVVVDSVTTDFGYAYYGEQSGSIHDRYVSALVTEVCQKASTNGVDFRKYIPEGASNVPLIVIFYAGQGQHAAYDEHWTDYIWPHFKQESRNINGTNISSYYVGNETLGVYVADSEGNPVLHHECTTGIGVLIHELGHALGLPDFYDTKVSGNAGTPSFWSVMDYGQYYQNGYVPVGYSTYERAILGWQDFKILPDTAQFCELNAQECLILRSPDFEDEPNFYVLENHQVDGVWYNSLLGSGLRIDKVNFNRSLWNQNHVNYNGDFHAVVVPADGEMQNQKSYGKDWTTFQNDLYPGNDKLYTTFMTDFVMDHETCGIYNIEMNDGVITFSYLDKNLKPTGLKVVENQKVNDATYDLQGRLSTGAVHGIYIKNGKKIIK